MENRIQSTQALSVTSIGSFTVMDVNKVTDLAPNWFKEGVIDGIRKGQSEDEAIKRMQSTPFFQKEWVA
ncbi:hypothetical protein JCM30760_27060 [Thiomicrorhabdus hydrogeniphila]